MPPTRINHHQISAPKDGEVPENFNVSEFIFTKRTITYDGKTIQLSNVTKIAKYGFRETTKPVFKVKDDILTKATLAAIGLLILSYFVSGISGLSTIVSFGFIVAACIAGYGYYERHTKKEVHEDFYGLIIETSSGKAENLLTNSKDFIWRLFNQITRAMNDVSFQVIEANFHTHDITYHDNSQIETIFGDKISGNTGNVLNKTQDTTIGNTTVNTPPHQTDNRAYQPPRQENFYDQNPAYEAKPQEPVYSRYEEPKPQPTPPRHEDSYNCTNRNEYQAPEPPKAEPAYVEPPKPEAKSAEPAYGDIIEGNTGNVVHQSDNVAIGNTNIYEDKLDLNEPRPEPEPIPKPQQPEEKFDHLLDYLNQK